MRITKNTTETATGPSESFTGTEYMDAVAAPSGPSRLGPPASTSRRELAPPGTLTLSGRPSTSQRASDSRSAAAAPSRRSARAIGCSSSPARTTGTVPPRTTS
jgi:hypothetical protein